MPKCSNCGYVQIKLNPGKLCKKCLEQKKARDTKNNTATDDINNDLIDPNEHNDDKNTENGFNNLIQDRSIMDIIKEFMFEEKLREAEMINVMKDQLEYLKCELKEKNKLIESLLARIPSAINKQIIDPDEPETISTLSNTSYDSTYESNNNFNNELNSSKSSITRNLDTPFISEYSKWHTVGDSKDKRKKQSRDIPINSDVGRYNNSITTSNRYEILDEYSDFEKEYKNAEVEKKDNSNHEQVDRNISNVKYPKRIPGNSSYSDITTNGKKCAIFSDSICGRIDMKKFNQCLKKSNAFRKTYLGASPKELHHYIAKPLEDEHPDTCIINVGTNRIGKDDSFVIANDIIKCVNRCKEFGANKVIVSNITYRPGYNKSIKGVNDILHANKILNDFEIIYNDNINASHLWRDNLHLNNNGRDILARNIINVVNQVHRY